METFTVELNEESDEDSHEELIKVKIPKNNKNKADWTDTNKLKIILTTIESNNFNHKNKIGKLKFNDINSLINNIRDDTISEANAKKKVNPLNEIKKAEIKNKCYGQKNLLNLFNDLLEAVLNNIKNKNENNNVSVNEHDNVSMNENDNDNVNDNVNENDNVNDNDNVDDNDSDNDNVDDYEIMKINNYLQINYYLQSKIIQRPNRRIKKERIFEWLWHMCYYDNNKEINLKIFKLKCAYILIDIDEQIFKEIFGYTLVA